VGSLSLFNAAVSSAAMENVEPLSDTPTPRDRRVEIYLAVGLGVILVLAILFRRQLQPTETYVNHLTIEAAGRAGMGFKYDCGLFTLMVPEQWATIYTAERVWHLRDPVSGGELSVATIQPVGRDPEDYIQEELKKAGVKANDVGVGGFTGYLTLQEGGFPELRVRAAVMGRVVVFTWMNAPAAEERFRLALKGIVWK